MNNDDQGVRQDRKVHHQFHDFTSDSSLSLTILEIIEQLSNADTTEMDGSLNEYVNPDALDSLFSPRFDGTPREDGGSISLELYDHDIVVHSDGHIIVSQPEK